MARLNDAQFQLLRIKSGITADADYTSPAVAIPGYAGQAGSLISEDLTANLAWSIHPYRTDGSPMTKILLKANLRRAATLAEDTGTFDAVAWAILRQDEKEANALARPSVVWLGALTAQPFMKPFEIDIGSFDVMGLSFSNIAAAGAGDTVFLYGMEWK